MSKLAMLPSKSCEKGGDGRGAGPVRYLSGVALLQSRGIDCLGDTDEATEKS